MSLPSRALPSNLRHTSIGSSQAAAGPSPILVARINEKKAELENLKQLRDLSGGLAAQMQALEDKLSTLADGTEAVAAVLSNWHSVMQAINMTSVKLAKSLDNERTSTSKEPNDATRLPQTLVRIPVEQDENASQVKGAEGTI